MLTDQESYITSIVLSTIGIGFSAFICFQNRLFSNLDEELDEYLSQQDVFETPENLPLIQDDQFSSIHVKQPTKLIQQASLKTYYKVTIVTDAQKESQAVCFSILGYALGTAYTSLFYREAGGMSAKGILIGRDLISKSNYQNYDQTVIEVNLNTASVISNIYNNNVISVLDNQTIFTAFFCTYLLLLSQSSEILTDPNQVAFYIPLVVFGINILIAIGAAYITYSAPTEIEEEANIAKDTGTQVRLQVLTCLIVEIVVLLVVPVFMVPEKFTIGSSEGSNVASHKDINISDTLWALSTGIIAQALLIVYGEYATSHYFSPTQKIAAVKEQHQKGGFSLTMISAMENAYVNQLGIFLLLGFAIFIGYLIAGLYGMACSLIGLLSAPFSLVSINIFAGLAQQSFEVSGIGYLRSMRQRLFTMSWVSLNFSIYTQIVNVIGVLLTSLLTVGVSVFVSKKYNVYVWDAYGIFGFLYGGSLAHFIKGISISGIRRVALSLRDGYFGKKVDKKPGEFYSNLQQVDTLMSDQYRSVIYRVAINIFVCIGSVIGIGMLLGAESVLSFVIGLNLVGVFLCFNSLIVGYSIKNARERNRSYGKITDVDEASVQTDVAASASEGIPGTSLVTYLIFISLFVVLGIQVWSNSGVLRKWVEEGDLNAFSDDTTDSFLKSVSEIPQIIQDAFDDKTNTEDGGTETDNSG